MKAAPASLLATLLIATTVSLTTAHAAGMQKSDATFSFRISAQSLSSALRDFAEATGLQLIYTPDLVAGVRTAGVSGKMTAAEALEQLLANSGVAFRYANENTITFEKGADKGARMLGPVRVEGANHPAVNGTNGSRDVTATEGTGSFTTGAMTIGSKSPRSIKDTPQSVSVITSEQLEQQNINDFTRALQQAPGISFAQGDTSLNTTFYSRGFAITSIQIDGGSPLTTRFAGSDGIAYFPQIDLSQYDHVEVLRGAAGLFNGYGDPSGTINLVRKQPLDHERVTLDTEWGSWNHYRTVLDATTPLAFDGRLRGRMVLTWQSNEHFYDIAEDEKTLLYGILSYELTPTTLLTAGVSKSKQDSTPWRLGLPRYQTGEDLQLPRSTCLCFSWNRWDFDTTEIFGSLEQQIGDDWNVRLNVTRNEQTSTMKIGSSSDTVNPVDKRGPRLVGAYSRFGSDQLAAEATLSGAFRLFGQRQQVTLGVNRSNQDGSGGLGYAPLINSTAALPYQPYPGGPRYCFVSFGTPCPAGTIPKLTPPVDVFAFNPFDPLYTEPAEPLPAMRYRERGQVQSLAYANFRLTAFDRLHLETGLRWSRYEFKVDGDQLCTSIPASGTPGASNCVGRQIGDAYNPTRNVYNGEKVSWPPSVALSYDLTGSLIAYLGYTDIYEDQSNRLDVDQNPLDPVTGDNVELGLKWAPRDGTLNTALSVYRIKKQGFPQRDPDVPTSQPDPYHTCCYFQREDRTQVSQGVDTELTGEVLPGWQVSASYTFSETKQEGLSYGTSEGRPFVTIQPKSLYKLWTSYDFGRSGASGWLSNLAFAAGVNGQSKGYNGGSTCPAGQVGAPRPDGSAPCLVTFVPYEFTVGPYAVFSGRVDYKVNEQWSAALNVGNIFDKIYYESVGGPPSGNWYGEPRNFMLTLRGQF